ncbi:MAG: hypothetical protein GY716_16980 [bacterium]|nr:hypothetical protein [bacterium]
MILRPTAFGKPTLGRIAALGLAVLTLAGPTLAAEATPAEAVRLYDEGNYAGARTLLEAIDARGEATGPLLYRLYYCRNRAGDPAARETLARAVTKLESEAPAATELEIPFYLSNAYSILGRAPDSRRAAGAATTRIESGEIVAPRDWLGLFRVGKLYADQANEEQASEWYGKALDARGPDSSSAYIVWAARYLSDRAANVGDTEQLVEYLGVIAEQDQANVADLDRLAMAQVRLARFGAAEQTWRAAERKNPSQGDRARYSWRLAKLAADQETLPDITPDGRYWESLNKEDLEKLLQEQSTIVRESKETAVPLWEAANALYVESEALKAEPEPESRKQRKQREKQINELDAELQAAGDAWRADGEPLQAVIDEAKAYFLAGAFEYVGRGNSIREAAFFGGYAPLIFHAREWQIRKP